jgi:hypothetical protein
MAIAIHQKITPDSADRQLGKSLVNATSFLWNHGLIVGADFANRFSTGLAETPAVDLAEGE